MDPTISISDPTVIALFQNAPSSSRNGFLTALSSYFQPSDWSHVHSLLYKRSYYLDFLPLLPLEVSLQVIQYLPLEQIFPLRRVSRRWNNLLTSPELCRSLNHHFFPLLADTHLDPVTHFENLATRRNSFIRCNPSYMEDFSVNGRCSFHADTSTFAFVTNKEQIQVNSLLHTIPLLPPKYLNDRSKISEVILSGSIVAAISTMGFCQVWDLSTHSTHSFKIPNNFTQSTHSDGNTIVIGFSSNFIIHNAVTKMTRVYPTSACIFSLIVHEPSNRVWIINVTEEHQNNITINSHSLETGDIIGTAEKFTFDTSAGARPEYAGNGIWHLQTTNSQTPEPKVPPMSIGVSQIRIDVHKQKTSSKSYTIALPQSQWDSLSLELYESYTSRAVYTWRDISWFYSIGSPADNWRITWEHKGLQARHDSIGKRSRIGVIGYNDRFIVLLYCYRMDMVVAMRFDGIHEQQQQ